MSFWETNVAQQLRQGNINALARCISLIENESIGYADFLKTLPNSNIPIIGITGPPGAGKSTLTDALIECIVNDGKKCAVLCVDPSSPFNLGALLGDRIRMSNWYSNPNVYIRSLATRGSLGGLHPKILEITDVLKNAWFDYVIVETVGVGQSEIEIAGLADATLVVLVPEAGDEIQTMKAGLMEIADFFVVNKADRPEANLFAKNLQQMLAPAFASKTQEIPILKTVASTKEGIEELYKKLINWLAIGNKDNKFKAHLLAQKAYQLIINHKMKNISKAKLVNSLQQQLPKPNFNIYTFIEHFMNLQDFPKAWAKQPTGVQVEEGKTYAWCTCGLSEKNPLCDGGHKKLAYEENGETIMPYKSLKFTAEKTEEIWLCNCKQTKNPPFCDGSHKQL